MEVSKVIYPNLPTDLPKVMIRILLIDPCSDSPKVQFTFDTFGQTHKIAFRLPVLINKFIEPVDMPQEKFQGIWGKFKKVDLILKNPAPSHLSVQDVLRKMVNLLSNCLKLKVFPPQNPQGFTKIQAVG